jgi:uncharacterized ferritin-like protein (DUF455 family)
MSAPPEGTVERWAWDYVTSSDVAYKLAPPPPPRAWEASPPVRRLTAPGRDARLVIAKRSEKTPGPEALRDPRRRAQVFHTFLHHELSAAELFAWAILAYPDAPRPFRGGLAKILMDEARHCRAYAGHLATLGAAYGDFPVRDWFWLRVPACETPLAFVSLVGMGLEGGNLDHAARFAARFRAVGDEEGARIQEVVAVEEIPHVRFAVRWFSRFSGGLDFARWLGALPPPITPILLRGEPMARDARRKAGFPDAFMDEIAAWQAQPSSLTSTPRTSCGSATRTPPRARRVSASVRWRRDSPSSSTTRCSSTRGSPCAARRQGSWAARGARRRGLSVRSPRPARSCPTRRRSRSFAA